MVGAMKPALIRILMAFETIIVHHQRPRRDEFARGGSGKGRMEILLSFFGANLIFPRVLGVKKDHRKHNCSDRHAPARANVPFDARSSQSMQDIEPNRQQRSNDMHPVESGAEVWVLDDEEIK